MRRGCSHLFPLIPILLLFPALSYGQAWSGILAPSRAIDWSMAGLPTTFPDGETTPNPWTPPSRTLCTTVNATGTAADVTNINSAVAGCGNGTYVQLHGNFAITNWLRIGGSNTNGHNNVTIRGDGPMTTKLTMASSGYGISTGAASTGVGSGRLTSASSNYTRGQTTFALQGVTGDTGSLAANNFAYLYQADNATDPLAPYHCQTTACATNGVGGNNSEVQPVRIVSAANNGGGNWTVTVSPGLYMQDWSFARGATLTWDTASYDTVGMGIEDLTIQLFDSSGIIELGNGYASWMKGVRVLDYNNSSMLTVTNCSHCLVANNYFFAESTANLSNSSYSCIFKDENSGDTLLLNNIGQQGLFADDGGHHQGFVMAYNYGRDELQHYYQATAFEHTPGSMFVLREGNQFGRINDDDTNNTHNLNTDFRNNLNCGDYPFDTGTIGGGLQYDAFSRFENAIGNAIGFGMPSKCPSYQGTADDGYVFNLNGGPPAGFDGTGLTEASLLRWGNVSTVYQASDTPPNSGIRFVSSEVPTNLSTWPNSAPYQNSVPANHNLPCSFFLQGYSSTTCTPKYSGGTGLSWWKVCDTWGTFPTSCAHYTIPPFPPSGPDILVANGAPADHANDIPAAVAWKNLPIDASFQGTYTVTGSSWSNGTETLTVSWGSGRPAITDNTHLMGGFQLTGVSVGCNPSGGELLMTGSSLTSLSYALPSNPNTTCTGTVKWPDVRQFDERVYENDNGGDSSVLPPSGLTAIVQ